jgi:glycosyltransferase involved in cell wall biosynthesis
MTSHTESFGIVLIEAMSHGVPCIAFSSAEGARELINSGENGYLINNRNFEMFEKKVIDLIEDKDVRKQIGKAARAGVKKYTSDVVKDDWFNLLENGDLNG